MANPWILAMRLRTLPAAISPVFVGTAIAYRAEKFDLVPFLAALFGACFIQLGANYANDVSDFKKGADTGDRLGPLRVTQAGLLTAKQVTMGAVVWFALAVGCGLILLQAAGWPVVAIGIASIIAAVLYVGGPIPYGYRGLGEFFVFLFFGLVAVGGTYFVQARDLVPAALLAGTPLGLLCANILIVNNVRDAATDRVANKRTLAVMFGEPFSRKLYGTFLALSFVAPIAGAFLGWFSPWSALALVSLPAAVKTWRAFNATEGRALNPILGETAKVELIYSLCFGVGLMLPFSS